MKMVRLASFLLVFLLLACTITAINAAMNDEPPTATERITPSDADPTAAPLPEPLPTEKKLPQVKEHSVQAASFTPRLTAPDEDNPCYYSSDNIFYAADYGMPNCTCYAWGRAYELTGEKPELSPYDACTWYGYNADNGIYDCGDQPREGAIACWAYADGGPGHVAVVEQVSGDTVLLSNSAYSGDEFYMDTVPADNPSEGRDGWIFQGYIYVNDQKTGTAL